MKILSSFLLLALFWSSVLSYAEESTPSDKLESLTSRELVKLLLDTDYRDKAFYHLWNRTSEEQYKNIEEFSERHYLPEIIVCPQPNGSEPLYMVLCSHFFPEPIWGDSEYKIKNVEKLFPVNNPRVVFTSLEDPGFVFFNADGESVAPYGGNNMINSPGIVKDINGDGLIERADHTDYGSDRASLFKGRYYTSVLQISTILPKPKVLLTVLYNRGKNEWSYCFTNKDGDGIFDIELGPMTIDGLKVKTVFRWDRTKGKYVSINGDSGAHFVRMENENIYEQIKKFDKEVPEFLTDPDYVDYNNEDWQTWSRKGVEKPSPKDVSKPYEYASLRNLSNEEIVEYMGQGKSMFELEWGATVKTRLPDGFWKIDPKQGALALAEANRYPGHKKKFRIAMDDLDGQAPPESGSILFSISSDRSYFAVDSLYFLRVDPLESYLVYFRSSASGGVFYNFVNNQPAYDIRIVKLSYKEAKYVSDTLWWLDRIRTHPVKKSNSISFGVWTNADGIGAIIMRPSGKPPVIEYTGTTWATQSVAERWSSDYNRNTFLNLSLFLISSLTERLGNMWSQYDQDQSRDTGGSPQYQEEELARMMKSAEQIIDMFTPDETAISYGLVCGAVRFAGDFALDYLSERLKEIEAQLPVSKGGPRTYEIVMDEMDKIEEKMPGADSLTKKALEKEWDRLWKESKDLRTSTGTSSIENLRNAITVSLKQIELANDAEALQKWASSKDQGFEWALQRLRKIDRKRYISSLEWWLKESKEEWARQIFAEIVRVDPKRAKDTAKKIPPDKQGDLTVPAFDLLKRTGEIENEQERVKSLIKVALDPGSGWDQRGNAIELLVPPDDPLKYPATEIDQALLKLMDPDLSDQSINFTLEKACRALARRGRVEYFSDIENKLQKISDSKSTGDDHIYHRVLGALTELAQNDPEKFNPRLKKILNPHLKRTNRMMTEILWSIWSANLKGMKTDVEKLATLSPDDYEDEKAHSDGGAISDVEGRFHLARQIVSIWNEEDDATRLKLLLAFGLSNCNALDLYPERMIRFKADFIRARKQASSEALWEYMKFVSWYEHRLQENRLESDNIKRILSYAKSLE